MGVCRLRLTILFEDPFWIVLYEREDERVEEQERQFALRQQKRKEKHRGH